MKKAVYAILMIVLPAVLFGCGKKTEPFATVQTQAPTVSTQAPTEPAKPVIEGIDVFDGAHFDEMLWGYYEASVYDYTGNSAEDTAAFRENMEYATVPSRYGQLQLSVLPLDIQMGSYSQFMPTFSYDGKYYSAHTEQGKAMFRKAYMHKYGDLTEEDFRRLERLFQLNVARMTFAKPDGNTQYSTFAYEIQADVLTFYKLSVDEKYNATIGDVYARFYFLHDGGKLILECNGVRREYLANGYKEVDKSRLRVAGYAQDPSKQYEDLEGFVLTESQEGEGYQVDIILSNNTRPADGAVTFNKVTGDFVLTWSKSVGPSGQIEHNTPRKISGKLIPCAGYGFNRCSGFYLLVEETCYSYIVSEDEYTERKFANIENADKISDLVREGLADVKVNMLTELEQAYEKAEMDVRVDFVRGQISIDAKYLFETDSQDISRKGQEYLARFVEIYTSVISKEVYLRYVSRLVIEGHTDTIGRYSHQQTLSMDRSDAVAKSCVEQSPDLGKDIQFTGCAYDYPIYSDDGSVNGEASNRMVFRFLLTAD